MSISIGTVLADALKVAFVLEQAMPQGGLGTTKKQIVLNSVEVGLQAASGISSALGNQQVSSITGIAGAFLDQTIALLNAAKAAPFGGNAAAPAPPVPTH